MDGSDPDFRSPALSQLEVPLVLMLAGWAIADEVQRRLDHDGFDDTRSADGVIFQNLITGPKTIGALANLVGVSQQATSKSIADLERRGYVERTPDPEDARVRNVELTERGHAAIAAGRHHRAELESELIERYGTRRVAAARRLLEELLTDLGAEATIKARRVRPPR